jgi:glycosyltransferase involved in cell wall biosynthesis
VGVCVRNSEDFIKETIESILAQDYPHELMELIFVDDGSEDNTLSVIQRYVPTIDFKTKVFHTSWKGLGHARNTVVANAEGDFILWIDGDMTIPSDFVRQLVGFMDQHPEIGIAKGKQALKSGANLLATLETYARAASRMVDYGSKKARLKALGTGAAIYRVEPLKSVGGFDESLKGYCEDWDVEIRIRDAGWSLCVADAKFLDYERYGLTWRSLWNKYRRRGYFTHYFIHKRPGLIEHYRMLPPAGFLLGLIHSRKLFKLTHQKRVFLLPLEYMFKMTAWCFGFYKSHLDSYQPK